MDLYSPAKLIHASYVGSPFMIVVYVVLLVLVGILVRWEYVRARWDRKWKVPKDI